MSAVRVLVVHPHALVRAAIAELLAGQSDFQVFGALATAEEALESLTAKGVDVVVSDTDFESSGGIWLAEQLRGNRSSARVVVLSDPRDPTTIGAAFAAGATAYVAKSAPPEDLFAAVRSASVGDLYLSGDKRLPLQNLGVRTGELTPRERDVVELIALGYTNRESAASLGISTKAVEAHRRRVMDKLGLRRRRDLVRFALDAGLLAPPERSRKDPGSR